MLSIGFKGAAIRAITTMVWFRASHSALPTQTRRLIKQYADLGIDLTKQNLRAKIKQCLRLLVLAKLVALTASFEPITSRSDRDQIDLNSKFAPAAAHDLCNCFGLLYSDDF